jgi:RNA polymerase sigma factor (sigma-70 family)
MSKVDSVKPITESTTPLEMYKQYEGLAVNVARKWRHRCTVTTDMDDIVSVAKAGLFQATKTWANNGAFAPYAMAVVNNAINKEFRNLVPIASRKDRTRQNPSFRNVSLDTTDHESTNCASEFVCPEYERSDVALERFDSSARLLSEIKKLPYRIRELLTARYFSEEEFNRTAVSARLGIKPRHSVVLESYGRKTLKEALYELR